MSVQKLFISLKLNLRKLILILLLVSLVILFSITLIVSNVIHRQQLINNSLATNYEYAAKVASISDLYFKNIFNDLSLSANIIKNGFHNEQLLKTELNRLIQQSNSFSSVLISDADGHVIEYAPETLKLDKVAIIRSLGFSKSLESKKPYISSPYYSLKGNLVVLVSFPIFDQNNKYQGFIAGFIYLHEESLLKTLLSENYGYKNSYLYVFDKEHIIIYHPERERIGKTFQHNTGLAYMESHSSGKIKLNNDMGVSELAGFAKIPTTNWTVVFQQPTEDLFAQARLLAYKVIGTIFVIYIIIFLIIWRISKFITSPLNDLAKMASHLNDPSITEKINHITPWYFEVFKFKKSLLSSVNVFNQEIEELKQDTLTAPLTGFYNRRGFELFLNDLISNKIYFAVVVLDIDYFKTINDRHGHDMGDVVLTKVAGFIRASFREQDICCRVGGEEFIILAPVKEISQATKIAERLRHKLASSYLLEVGVVTASLGIAHWPLTSSDIKEVLKQADTNLYQAKHLGRNRVVTGEKSA